jgi:hypothetical protein
MPATVLRSAHFPFIFATNICIAPSAMFTGHSAMMRNLPSAERLDGLRQASFDGIIEASRLRLMDRSTHDAFRPHWVRSGLALVGAILFGAVGISLQFLGTCLDRTHDCAAYSPVKIAVAEAMSWPIFMVQSIAFGGSGFVLNYDPVVHKYWWLLLPILWFYYYLVLAVATIAITSTRSLWGRARSARKVRPTNDPS